MSNKIGLFVIIICYIFAITNAQLVIPLSHNQISDFQRQDFNVNHKKNHIFHNFQFLNRHQKQTHLTFHLRTQKLNQQNIQTYNLKSQVSKFSLVLKVAGYNYNMQIDSGSSDIFIKGENAYGLPKQRYQCGQLCIDNNPHYSLGYLDGDIKTYEKQLQVQLGNHKFNQSILVAYQVQENFKKDTGLIGLSYPNKARNPKPNFLLNLINLKIIDSYAFGVNLNFQNKKRSFITFGSYDPQFLEGGHIFFAPLISKKEYLIGIQGISIGNSEILYLSQALLDTGNTCISIPHQYQKDILKQFKSNDKNSSNICYFSVQKNVEIFSILRCKITNFDILPVLSIHIGERKFQIEKQYYLQNCGRRPGQQNISNIHEGSWFCQTYIESVKRGQLFLGDGFFNRFYTFFDLENKRIGIGKNNQKNSLKPVLEGQIYADYEDWKQILQNLQNTSQSMNALDKKFNKKKSYSWLQSLLSDFTSFWDAIL